MGILALACAATCGCLLFSAAEAPLIFSMLPGDHALAGRLAGRLFAWSYWCAAVVGLLALTLPSVRRGAPRWSAWSLAGLAVLQLAVVVPGIVSHGVGWPISFAALHGAALLVHMGLVASAFCLAWLCLKDRPSAPGP